MGSAQLVAGLVTPAVPTTFAGRVVYGVVDTEVMSWQLLFGAAVVSDRRGKPYVVLISVVSSAS